MLLNIPEEHIITILSNNRSLLNYNKYVLISKYISKILIEELKKMINNSMIISPLIKLWNYQAHNFIIMNSIKDKLYKSNCITLNYYNQLNSNTIEEFDESIGWNNSYIDDLYWINIFNLTFIEWTEEEKIFLGFNYRVYFDDFNIKYNAELYKI